MSKDDDERLRNLVIFKVYATDDEMADAAPIILGVLAVVAIIGGLWLLFS